jgi:hypothetical protein
LGILSLLPEVQTKRVQILWLERGELFKTPDQEVAFDIKRVQELLEENDPYFLQEM